MNDDDDVLEEFSLEAEELLAEAEEVLLKIEDAQDFASEFNKIFRSFHSLKGAAGMFEIDKLQSFMHIIEGQFESTRDVGSMDQFQVDYFLMAIDSARKILSGQEAELDTNLFHQQEGAPSDLQAQNDNQEPSSEEVEETMPKSSHENLNDDSDKSTKDEISKGFTDQAQIIRDEIQDKSEIKAQTKGLIYVIDDEEMICEALAEMLRDHDYEVLTFTHPSEVLSQVQQREPDLICTDLKMPQMSGLDLLTEMREHDFEFPIVFITGFIDNDLLTQGLQAGANGFLEKPFEEHQVVCLVKNSIERYKTWKLLNKSINYILYQFNDLDKYLEEQGRNALRTNLRFELQELLKLRKNLM